MNTQTAATAFAALPVNQRIATLIIQRGCMTADQVLDALPGVVQASGLPIRLANMVEHRYLDSDLIRGRRIYTPGPRKYLQVTRLLADAAAQADAAARWVGEIVPPRRLSMLDTGPYIPSAARSTRPGAEDHRRHASRGVRC